MRLDAQATIVLKCTNNHLFDPVYRPIDFKRCSTPLWNAFKVFFEVGSVPLPVRLANVSVESQTLPSALPPKIDVPMIGQ